MVQNFYHMIVIKFSCLSLLGRLWLFLLFRRWGVITNAYWNFRSFPTLTTEALGEVTISHKNNFHHTRTYLLMCFVQQYLFLINLALSFVFDFRRSLTWIAFDLLNIICISNWLFCWPSALLLNCINPECILRYFIVGTRSVTAHYL